LPPDSGQVTQQRTIVIRSANDRPPSPAPDDAAAWPSAG
jgi:hypothetical protein